MIQIRGHKLPFFATALIGCAALLSSCSGSRSATLPDIALPEAFPNHEFEQIRSMVAGRSDTVAAFSARASVSVRSPRQSGRFNSSIAFRRADSLYLNVRALLGIEAARALVTPDSFFVYDRIKRKLYVGDIRNASSSLPMPIPLGGSGAFEAMLGLNLGAGGDWTVNADSATYILTSRDERVRVTVDPRYWRVSSYIRNDGNGGVIERRKYSEFHEVEGVILPRRVELAMPMEDTFASIYYGRLDLNPDELNLRLDVSDGTERVRMK